MKPLFCDQAKMLVGESFQQGGESLKKEEILSKNYDIRLEGQRVSRLCVSFVLAGLTNIIFCIFDAQEGKSGVWNVSVKCVTENYEPGSSMDEMGPTQQRQLFADLGL